MRKHLYGFALFLFIVASGVTIYAIIYPAVSECPL